MITHSTIEAVKNKDNRAFKVLYQKCIPYVYTLTQRHIANDGDIQDVIQEVFARVFLSIKTFDPDKGEFKSWLRRLTINQCYQYYRKDRFMTLHIELDDTHEITDETLPLNDLSKEDIEKLLEKMPDGYRRVFLLVVIDEFSHKEVGDLLDISPEASRSQLFRAKTWLRHHSSQAIKTIANGHS